MIGFGNAFHLLFFSVLANSSPTRLFQLSRGLWQGDPLSPFLFTMVVEALSALLLKAKECGPIGGFKAGSEDLAITHLQFADDTIFFKFANMEEVVAVKRFLACFELSSGLKLNLSKSMMVGVSCTEEVVRSLDSTFRRKIGKLPLLFLCLPIGAHSKSISVWNPLVENFERAFCLE